MEIEDNKNILKRIDEIYESIEILESNYFTITNDDTKEYKKKALIHNLSSKKRIKELEEEQISLLKKVSINI